MEKILAALSVILIGLAVWQAGKGHEENRLTAAEVESYRRQGILVLRRQLLSPAELETVTDLLLAEVSKLPAGSIVETSGALSAAHLRFPAILAVAQLPSVVAMAGQLLGVAQVDIFTTRILCKPPRVGVEVPWHQDSAYWPLQPLSVASFWLALDDVTPDNGGMRMVNFTGMPEVRGSNLQMVKEEEDGGSNFFQHIREGVIREEAIVVHRLKRGEGSFHDSYIPHSSPPNLSPDRRCAWIVRCHQRSPSLKHLLFVASVPAILAYNFLNWRICFSVFRKLHQLLGVAWKFSNFFFAHCVKI